MTGGMRLRRKACAAVVGFVMVSPILAQETDQDLREEIAALKAGQQAIQKQLEEIKKLVAARPAAAPAAGPTVADVVFDLGANPVKGEQTAKFTLVEFTDYQ